MRYKIKMGLIVFGVLFVGMSTFILGQYHIHEVVLSLYYPYLVGAFLIAAAFGLMMGILMRPPVIREYEYVINGEADVPKVVMSMHMAMAEAECKMYDKINDNDKS